MTPRAMSILLSGQPRSMALHSGRRPSKMPDGGRPNARLTEKSGRPLPPELGGVGSKTGTGAGVEKGTVPPK